MKIVSKVFSYQAKAEKIIQNKKGYWEAVFFNDTVMVYLPRDAHVSQMILWGCFAEVYIGKTFGNM